MIETTLTMWGEPHKITFRTSTYCKGNTLYVGVMKICSENGEEWQEPWCHVTVNLPGGKGASETKAYLDTNNCSPEIISWLEENEYIKDTYIFEFSGFCMYPLYEFTEKFFNEMKGEEKWNTKS